MSQSNFGIVSNISELIKIAVQVIMFIILWVAVLVQEKRNEMALWQVCFSLPI